MKKLFILFASLSLIVPLLFFGCGSGDTGPAGPPGPPGQDEGGLPGPLTNTDEACMVCHTNDRIVDISDVDPTSLTHYFPNLHLADMVVDSIVVGNTGGIPTVSFRVRSGSPLQPVTSLDNTVVRFMIADLVPANTVTAVDTTPRSTAEFDRWAYDRTSTGLPNFGTFDNVTGAATGNYSYTFKRGYGVPTPNDNLAPVAFDPTHVQRMYIRISKPGFNNAAAYADFIVPADGATTTGIGYFERQFVTIDACRKCHGPILANTAHGSGYVDVKTCVLCHSPISSANEAPDTLGRFMVNEGAWLASLIHKIHAAIPMPAFPTRLNGKGYGAVTYPQDVRNCVTCHTNSGLNLGAGDFINNWRAHPTAAACSTCHEGFPLTSHNANPVHATNGTAHPGNINGAAPPDSSCGTCHPATGESFGDSVTDAHDISPTAALHPDPKSVPEFNVTLNLTAPSNGRFYRAGIDNVLVTVTLRKSSDNTAVDNAVYTSLQGAAGVAGGGLRVASLYVYGPRSFTKPVLAAQATNLFVSATDPNVQTDANGFKYLVRIPAGLTAGTYMVRVRIGDYGRVSPAAGQPDTNYIVESIAFRTVQVGILTGASSPMIEVLGDGIGDDDGICEATPAPGEACFEPKVAGDTCVNCHGNGNAKFHDARHVVVWDTDQCISCHDYSGGHAAVLSNRAHAVHAGNSRGDMSNTLNSTPATFSRKWDHVFYPADKHQVGAIYRPDRCTICHSDPGTAARVPSYRRVVHEVACLGCHGDFALGTSAPGPAINHMLQMGGDFPALAAP